MGDATTRHLNEGRAPGDGLAALAKAAQAGGSEGLPPIHTWRPQNCGPIPMTIGADGTWFYQGTPIGRKRLVRLFSTILLREEDGSYHLVTPVEKAEITVEDAPFLAVEMRVEGAEDDPTVYFRTNVDDWTRASAQTPLRVTADAQTGEPAPYILVRDRLEAKLTRSVFYELVERAVERDGRFVVRSAGRDFDVGPAA